MQAGAASKIGKTVIFLHYTRNFNFDVCVYGLKLARFIFWQSSSIQKYNKPKINIKQKNETPQNINISAKKRKKTQPPKKKHKTQKNQEKHEKFKKKTLKRSQIFKKITNITNLPRFSKTFPNKQTYFKTSSETLRKHKNRPNRIQQQKI